MRGAAAGPAAALALMAGVAAAEDAPALRLSTLEFGAVGWELDTVEREGLDARHGFDLQVEGVANPAASRIAFQAGEADAIVSDWIWVARQRAAGRDYVFTPYPRAVGGMMVGPGSEAETLADLAGARVGVAGGPLDKSRPILQAYARQAHGLELADAVEPVFAAPPLIYSQALSGELDAAVNYWRFLTQMEAAGMREPISLAEAAGALDLETPLLGYVVKGELARERPELVAGFAAASREAKTLPAEDGAAREPLRERMRAGSEAEVEALKAGFRGRHAGAHRRGLRARHGRRRGARPADGPVGGGGPRARRLADRVPEPPGAGGDRAVLHLNRTERDGGGAGGRDRRDPAGRADAAGGRARARPPAAPARRSRPPAPGRSARARSTPRLEAMAQLFGMSRAARMRHVTAPQLAPHAAARRALADLEDRAGRGVPRAARRGRLHDPHALPVVRRRHGAGLRDQLRAGDAGGGAPHPAALGAARAAPARGVIAGRIRCKRFGRVEAADRALRLAGPSATLVGEVRRPGRAGERGAEAAEAIRAPGRPAPRLAG
jgi:NitT/TauT family transport system substrate-binding protein